MRARLPRLSAALFVAVLFASAAAAQGAAQTHPGDYAPPDIAYGSRLYDAQCTTCHGANGDGVGGVDLRSGKFRNAVTDQDLVRVITTGIPGTGMQAFRFDPSEISGIVAYLRNMNTFDRGSIKAGDAARGRAVVDGKGTCARCHRVGTQGSRVAPDLTDIGAVRSAGSLLRSLIDPSSQMMPINRPVRVASGAGRGAFPLLRRLTDPTSKIMPINRRVRAAPADGKVINGRRLNEDTYSVQLIDDQERLVSLVKGDLREYTILTASPMPSYK